MPKRLASNKSPYKGDATGAAGTFTYGVEAANARSVSLQLTDDRGTAIAVKTMVRVFLSQAAGGAALVTTVPDGGIAIGAAGQILQVNVAGKDLTCITNAAGLLTLTVTESTAKSFFPNAVLATGELINGATLTFA